MGGAVPRRILFLDIDGVLNSHAFFDSRGPRLDGQDMFDRHIDEAALMRLNYVLRQTDAHVVISSTWRELHTLPDLRRGLKRRGFAGRIIGKTPCLERRLRKFSLYEPVPRGLEIARWLKRHPPVDSFAIVDDDSDMAHLAHRFVQTDMRVGLTDADADALITLLREDLRAEAAQ